MDGLESPQDADGSGRTVPGSPAVPGTAGGPALEIREVTTRRDLERFVEVPWPIYADDPHWVPPLRLEVKEFLNPRKHPFYRHGTAAKLMALRGGLPLGRILVSDDPRYNQQNGTNTGCFGMFECADDPQAAHALLDAAAAWLRARGRSAVMGPVDYSTNYPCGLLVEGFQTPPRVMMNHNPPYYAPLLESWGLVKAKDLHSWWFDDPHDMVSTWHDRARRLARRSGVTIRAFRKGDFDAEVERCRAVYNQAGSAIWGFVGLSDAEFRYAARRLLRIAIPQLVLLAELDGQPVGFSVTLPDLNEAIRPLGGRLSRFGLPIGALRLAWRLPRVRTARVAVLYLREGYRRRGIGELLILRTLDYGKNTRGYTGAELGWTTEDNEAVIRTVQSVGAERYKTYRVYQKQLG